MTRLTYWWSDAAEAWLVAAKDGELIATIPDKASGVLTIEKIFMPEIIEYDYKECDLGRPRRPLA